MIYCFLLLNSSETGVKLLALSDCWCGMGPTKIVHPGTSVVYPPCVQRAKVLPTYIQIFENMLSKAEKLASNWIH
ncbi:hypothetical protein T06_2179 [Trichinella sp. T6]|nr:hypothetical protein T06_2179 [Trichinella sp. T6]